MLCPLWQGSDPRTVNLELKPFEGLVKFEKYNIQE